MSEAQRNEDPLGRIVGRLSSMWQSVKRKRREQLVLNKCGCVCRCPACGDVLNDQAACHPHGDGRYKYICGCGQVSDWHFGIAPVPILLSPNG